LVDGLDAVTNHPLIEFQLLLTRATHADTTLLSIQMGPPAFQACAQVLQLRQLYLQLTFVAVRALREDIQNQSSTIEYATLEFGLEVAFLAGRECVIKQNKPCFVGEHGGLNLFKLA
jgi:hypothetical protein